MTAATEFVVPRSIPMIFAMIRLLGSGEESAIHVPSRRTSRDADLGQLGPGPCCHYGSRAGCGGAALPFWQQRGPARNRVPGARRSPAESGGRYVAGGACNV